MWSGSAWKYASCPRCYRQELTTWSLQYYHPPTSIFMKIKFGATPYRCAACRCNFASFRPLRKRYSNRARVEQAPSEVAQDLPALAEAVGLSDREHQPHPATHGEFTESSR